MQTDTYFFYHISLISFPRMRNISDKSFRENQITNFMFSNFFFFENRAVCEIIWKIIVERGRRQMAIWRMRIACWITEATNTHSDYVIIIAFPLHQFLHKGALNVRLYVHCLSCYNADGECLLRGRNWIYIYIYTHTHTHTHTHTFLLSFGTLGRALSECNTNIPFASYRKHNFRHYILMLLGKDRLCSENFTKNLSKQVWAKCGVLCVLMLEASNLHTLRG
jgi:hypothetical protein